MSIIEVIVLLLTVYLFYKFCMVGINYRDPEDWIKAWGAWLVWLIALLYIL